jgi:membrane dipeptidase
MGSGAVGAGPLSPQGAGQRRSTILSRHMPTQTNDSSTSSRAAALLRSALVWDNVFPINLPGEILLGNSWEALERFRRVGVDVVSITLAGDNHNISQAVTLCAWARRELRERPDRFVLVRRVSDIELARRTGRLGVILHFEGTRCFERDPSVVELFYDLGIRQTLIAFNKQNSAGGGCADAEDRGLTPYGRRVVQEMQRVGMLVDLSHTGHRTSLDAVAAATQPVLFSHSNAYALCPSFRNLKDDQIRACAETGGVVGVSGSSEYLGDSTCSEEAIFRHIHYMVEVGGIDHVGLGLDVVFEPQALSAWARGRPDEWPMTKVPGWPGFRYAVPEQLPGLTELMLRRGYSEQQVRKVLGENLLRVCRAAWRDTP